MNLYARVFLQKVLQAINRCKLIAGVLLKILFRPRIYFKHNINLFQNQVLPNDRTGRVLIPRHAAPKTIHDLT